MMRMRNVLKIAVAAFVVAVAADSLDAQINRGNRRSRHSASPVSMEWNEPVAPAGRARQALWHAQGDRERKSLAANNFSQFGFQPRHQKLARVSAGSSIRQVSAEALEPQSMPDAAATYPSGDQTPVEGFAYGAEEHYGADECVVNDGTWDGDVAYELNGTTCDCDGGCFECIPTMPPAAVYLMGDATIFLGTQGFTNPINDGVSGSFGFHQGFNLGTAMPFFPYSGLGWQFGLRTTQSNLEGTGQTNNERRQTFITTGIFKRTDWGCQAGLVVDILNDKWLGSANLNQLRGEISWIVGNRREIGYWFAASGDNDSYNPGLQNPLSLSVSDVQGFFYRHQSTALPGASGRLFVGFSNDGDTIFSSSTRVPLTGHFAMQTSATYLIPDERTGAGAAENEVWNLGISLVFSFRGAAANTTAPFAPLFDVADNGSFFVDVNQVAQ